MLDPVPTPPLKQGQDTRLALAKTRAANDENVTRLTKSRMIYKTIRQEYAK